MNRARTVGLVALLTVAVVTLGILGSFLVPLRAGGVDVPASLAIAALNLPLGYAALRAGGRPAAAVVALAWLAVTLTLGTTRAEGDLVIPSGAMGVGFLAVGTLAAGIPLGLGGRKPQPG